MNKFYIYNGETWFAEDKKLRFIKVSDPESKMTYASIHPDKLDEFVEIKPISDNYNKNSPQEKLFRVLTDLSTVTFLSEKSFFDISRNLMDYLEEKEEWERMCVIRDIMKFYENHHLKKKIELDEFIKKHDKPAAEGDS